MKKEYTTKQKIWAHLQVNGVIDHDTAHKMYGTHKLPEYIRRLRKSYGFKRIDTIPIPGRETMQYVLKKEINE